MRVCRWRRMSLEIHCCTLFLKVSWAKKGILSGRLNLGTVALRKLSTRRSRARALDRQGCSMWLARRYSRVTVSLSCLPLRSSREASYSCLVSLEMA